MFSSQGSPICVCGVFEEAHCERFYYVFLKLFLNGPLSGGNILGSGKPSLLVTAGWETMTTVILALSWGTGLSINRQVLPYICNLRYGINHTNLCDPSLIGLFVLILIVYVFEKFLFAVCKQWNMKNITSFYVSTWCSAPFCWGNQSMMIVVPPHRARPGTHRRRVLVKWHSKSVKYSCAIRRG